MESQVLERIGDRPKPPEPPKYARRTVYVLVDSFDLATSPRCATRAACGPPRCARSIS